MGQGASTNILPSITLTPEPVTLTPSSSSSPACTSISPVRAETCWTFIRALWSLDDQYGTSTQYVEPVA